MLTSGGYIKSLAKPRSVLRFFAYQWLTTSVDSPTCLGCRCESRTERSKHEVADPYGRAVGSGQHRGQVGFVQVQIRALLASEWSGSKKS